MLFGRSPNVEKLETKRNQKGLIKALSYKKDWKVRLKAVKALSKIGSFEAIAPLNSTLNDFEEKRSVRTAAVKAIGEIGTPEAIRQLIENLWLSDDKLSAELEKVLIGLGNQSVEPLIGALNDSYSGTRRKAAIILGKIGDPRSALPLTKLIFDEDEEEDTAAAAVEALGGFEGPVIGLLDSILELDQYPISEAAVVALGKIDDINTLAPLSKALLEGDEYLKFSAIEALAQKGEQAIEPLLAGLKDQDCSIRLAAAEALDKLNWQPGSDENAVYYWVAKDNWKWKRSAEFEACAVNALLHHLKNDNLVNEKVIEALVKIGKPALADLLKALDSDNKKLSSNAAITLGRIGDLRAVDPIIKWIFSGNEQLHLENNDMQKLFGDYTKLILESVSLSTRQKYNSAPNAEHENYDIIYDQELAHEATAKLCSIKSEISSNILHLITARKDITVIIAFHCITYRYGEISFVEQRQVAAEELTKRGSPPYNCQAYYNKEAWTL